MKPITVIVIEGDDASRLECAIKLAGGKVATDSRTFHDPASVTMILSVVEQVGYLEAYHNLKSGRISPKGHVA